MIRPRFSRDIILEEGHWALPYQPSSFRSPTPHGKLLAGQESYYSVLVLTSLTTEQLRLPLPLLLLSLWSVVLDTV